MALVVAVASLIGAVSRSVMLSFPTAEECTASGRTIDATFRHCESAEGYTELREHALFHVRDALYYVVVLGLGAWAVVHALGRRRASDTAPRA